MSTPTHKCVRVEYGASVKYYIIQIAPGAQVSDADLLVAYGGTWGGRVDKRAKGKHSNYTYAKVVAYCS